MNQKTDRDLIRALIRSAARKNVQDMWTRGAAYRDGWFELFEMDLGVKISRKMSV